MFRLATSCLIIATTVFCELNCDFRTPCCWKGDKAWEQRHGKSININEFRRTFLVGKSRPPPVGNYVMRVVSGTGGTFTSCPFCSSNGEVVVQYRQWQSPTARLRVCWLSHNEILDTSIPMDCQPALASRQSQINSQFFNVTANQNIQLVFMAEATESSSRAVVLLDRIRIVHEECESRHVDRKKSSSQRRVVLQPSRTRPRNDPTNEHRSIVSNAVTTKRNDIENGFKMKRIHKASRSNEKRKNLESVVVRPVDTTRFSLPVESNQKPEHSPSSLTSVEETTKQNLVSSEVLSQKTEDLIPPSPTKTTEKEFNPLADLLGEDLANFLDPDYVTEDYDEPVDSDFSVDSAPPAPVQKEKETQEEKPVIPAVQRTSHIPKTSNVNGVSRNIPLPNAPLQVHSVHPLSVLHRPLPLGVPSECSTRGGCLFEHGLCGWTAPDHVSLRSRFRKVHVGLTNFAQSDVRPGEVSILEIDSPLEQNHTVVFDALEWKQGTRLIGCCFSGSTLNCPFATPTEAVPILWQIGQFECATSTEKIVFICENYGLEDGVCGVDNIRVHRSTDIFFLEPCQKTVLSSL